MALGQMTPTQIRAAYAIVVGIGLWMNMYALGMRYELQIAFLVFFVVSDHVNAVLAEFLDRK